MKSSSHPAIKSLLTPIALGLMVPIAVTAYTGCKKDEPPPPLPSAAPTPTPSAPLELVVEDSGPDVVPDADAAPKKYTGSVSSLKKCCAAIAQNAANAPEPTATYMKQFAAACSAAAASGNTAGVNAAARQAGVACK
jgi:hypothetical protein